MQPQHAKKAKFGGAYGAAAGLAFAVGSAGYNAYYMAQGHVILAGMPFLLLGLTTTVLGWLIGWFTTQAGKTALTAVTWMIFGVLAATLAALFPLWLQPQLVSASLTNWQPVLTFGWQENHWLLLGFSVLASFIFFLILGLLQGTLVDGAYYAVSAGGGINALLVAMLLAGGVGGVVDTLVNRPIRTAVTTLTQVIDYQMAHANEDISKEVSRSMRLSALRNIKGSLDDHWSMAIASVDLAYSETHILLFTGDVTSLCYLFSDQLSNCMIQPTP